MCPADQSGPVDVSVYRAAAGEAELGTATIQPAVAGPDPLDVTATAAPASVTAGVAAVVSGTVSDGSSPVRATATWYSAPAGSTAWVRIAGPVATSTGGTTSISVKPTASTTYRLVVATPAASTWTSTPAVATVTVVKRAGGDRGRR